MKKIATIQIISQVFKRDVIGSRIFILLLPFIFRFFISSDQEIVIIQCCWFFPDRRGACDLEMQMLSSGDLKLVLSYLPTEITQRLFNLTSQTTGQKLQQALLSMVINYKKCYLTNTSVFVSATTFMELPTLKNKTSSNKRKETLHVCMEQNGRIQDLT